MIQEGHGEILILGAGPAGMAAALELSGAGKRFTLVERAEQVGGLAKTYRFGDFKTDNGPHRFFSQNQYLYQLIGDLLHEHWVTVDRYTRFYINGKFYKYPIEWGDALVTMGLGQASRFVLDYLYAKVRYARSKPKNFEDYTLATFGRSLAEFNILNYTEKIWGVPTSELSTDWADQRIRGLGIFSILKNLVTKQGRPKSLVDQFYYPDQGTGMIYEAMREQISTTSTLLLQTEPTRVTHTTGRITEVVLSNGSVYHPHYLISSIPITKLVQLLSPAPPPAVLKAAAALHYRSQVYLFLTIDTPSISRDQWIYFPNQDIPFGRISEMKNFSKAMSPTNQTSLFVEFFCWEGDATWSMSKAELEATTLSWLARLGLVDPKLIISSYHLKAKDIYPVYSLGYQEHLATVKHYLDALENLVYIGRPGRFKYTNQDHSLEMGIQAARSVLEGKRLDLERIGAEQAYFERGTVRRS